MSDDNVVSGDRLVPDVLMAYREQEAEDDSRFDASMKHDGWVAQFDDFGAEIFWIHRGTKRIVQHTAAFDIFKVTSATPIPF